MHLTSIRSLVKYNAAAPIADVSADHVRRAGPVKGGAAESSERSAKPTLDGPEHRANSSRSAMGARHPLAPWQAPFGPLAATDHALRMLMLTAATMLTAIARSRHRGH